MTLSTLRVTTFALLFAWPFAAEANSTEIRKVPERPAAVAAPQVKPAPAPAAPTAAASGSETQQYCQNIAAAASDARFAWQKQQLGELEQQLKQRVTELDAKETEYKQVLDRRDAAMKRAEETLVGIYAKMRPDAAASQLSALDDETAAAVLMQLNPRVSSAILNEFEPERAVRLVNQIAGTTPADGKKS